jgi:sialate O-acetylesterase
VPGASNELYDHGDNRVEPRDGYGSMQAHAPDGTTLFALNNWKAGREADLGIGKSPEGNPDWTFRKNAGTYTAKRLRVFVLP